MGKQKIHPSKPNYRVPKVYSLLAGKTTIPGSSTFLAQKWRTLGPKGNAWKQPNNTPSNPG